MNSMTLLDYWLALARHKLLIGVVALLVPVGALYFSLSQEPRFKASSEVLLSRQDLASALTSIPNPNADIQPELLTTTQERLARVPEVARRTLIAAGVTDRDSAELLESSSVRGEANTDVLTFTVTNDDPAVARALATAYAEQFTEYRHELEIASVRIAGSELEERLSELRAADAERTAFYRTLVAKQRQLETLEVLQTPSASVIRRAAEAAQVQPRPLRALALALPLGVLLAMAFALVAHLLDTRVWSASEIAQRLSLRLLGRVPDLPRRFRPSDRLVMLHRPRSGRAGVFRVLRANLELANRTHEASTIMFTSAGAREGKSTTVANLAIALARAGRDVLLVDLDLRRPTIGALFGLDGRTGLSEVIMGRAELQEALVEVPVHSASGSRRRTTGGLDLGGVLRVLPAGRLSVNLADLADSAAVPQLLEQAQAVAGVVLIDAPPLLDDGVTIALSAHVEGVVLVARARKLRRALLGEVRRLLAGTPSIKLGVVVTAADIDADDADGAHSAVITAPVEARAA
jgi:polysaccharide biosynthesis transport protein